MSSVMTQHSNGTLAGKPICGQTNAVANLGAHFPGAHELHISRAFRTPVHFVWNASVRTMAVMRVRRECPPDFVVSTSWSMVAASVGSTVRPSA